MTEYIKQAIEFLNKTNSQLSIEFSHNGKHFDDDKSNRDIYNVTLSRGQRSYKFKFGQSIMNSQYYQDRVIKGRTYTTDGKARTGNYSINDLNKYDLYMKLIKGTKPSEYDILSCLTTYDPDTFENFCSEFGYDTDSKKAEKTYNAVKDEFMNLCALFNDSELDLLREIQ